MDSLLPLFVLHTLCFMSKFPRVFSARLCKSPASVQMVNWWDILILLLLHTYAVSLWCNKRWVSFYFIGFGRFFFTPPSPSHSARSGENSGSSEEFLKRIFMFALHILFRLDKYLCFMRCISSILITVFCRLLGAVMGNPRRLSFATSTSSRKSRKIVHAKR